MNKNNIKKLKVDNEIQCCPKHYRHMPDVFDDYDVNSMLFEIKDQKIINRTLESINCETDYVYGPSTGYKDRYRYNRND
jgi:hypothetical protein